jgi:C4-dicarboxylate-binding protein DctP
VTSTEWLNSLDADVRDQFLTIVNDVTNEANASVAAKEAWPTARTFWMPAAPSAS